MMARQSRSVIRTLNYLCLNFTMILQVTQDFIKYLGNRLPSEEREEGKSSEEREEEVQQDFGVPMVDAETIVCSYLSLCLVNVAGWVMWLGG